MNKSDYKELLVWQKAINLTIEIYRLVKLLPKEETYALSDQLRRASVSVASNIAEGHGRGSHKDFVKFLYISKGSLLEVETQLIICNHLDLLSQHETSVAYGLIVEIDKMIAALISYRQNLTPQT